VAANLTPEEIGSFVRDGFLRVEKAVPRDLADEGRALLWAEMGLPPDDPSGWTQAVIRLLDQVPRRSSAPPTQNAYNWLLISSSDMGAGSGDPVSARFRSDFRTSLNLTTPAGTATEASASRPTD